MTLRIKICTTQRRAAKSHSPNSHHRQMRSIKVINIEGQDLVGNNQHSYCTGSALHYSLECANPSKENRQECRRVHFFSKCQSSCIKLNSREPLAFCRVNVLCGGEASGIPPASISKIVLHHLIEALMCFPAAAEMKWGQGSLIYFYLCCRASRETVYSQGIPSGDFKHLALKSNTKLGGLERVAISL